MNKENNVTIEEKEKTQFILDKYGELAEIPISQVKVVEKVNIPLINAFEVFVPITENYYISNYGRIINNWRNKNKFHIHRNGNVHVTIHEKDVDGTIYKTENFTEELVSRYFLRGGGHILHIDGNKDNNYYKNLVLASSKELYQLRNGLVTRDELIKRLIEEQEYIEYSNSATQEVYKVYNGIKARTDEKNKGDIAKCYKNAKMCDEWLNEPRKFVKWYLKHYYTVDDESMAVDKDLFGNGSHLYSPETCCILPQGLNTMLTNCKKHYSLRDKDDNTLPLGVRKSNDKYMAEISFMNSDNGEVMKLSEWDSPEEAFEEYKAIKKADMMLMCVKYKNKIPNYIYRKLLDVEIEPY